MLYIYLTIIPSPFPHSSPPNAKWAAKSSPPNTCNSSRSTSRISSTAFSRTTKARTYSRQPAHQPCFSSLPSSCMWRAVFSVCSASTHLPTSRIYWWALRCWRWPCGRTFGIYETFLLFSFDRYLIPCLCVYFFQV